MKLGKREIDALAFTPGLSSNGNPVRDRMVFDDDLKGFAVRITADGMKTFLFQYRAHGVIRRVRIGAYGEVTPAQARKRAEVLRGQVTEGRNPAAERRDATAAEAAAVAERKRQKQAAALTFGKLIEEWKALRLSQGSARHQAEAVRALRFNLAQLIDKPAAEIDAETARRAIEAIPRQVAARVPAGADTKRHADAPEAAQRGATMGRRARSYARAMYSWALGRGLVQNNPFAKVKPDTREASRERCLTDRELGEVWRATGTLGWPWGPYLRLLLLTLQRQGEVAGAAWAELSPDLALWELPGRRMKNGKPHFVHLSEPARAILRAAPRVPDASLIFTTTGRTPISGFSKAKTRLDEAIARARAAEADAASVQPALMPPWHMHDLRRTGVTALARLGVRWEVADKLLAHTQGRISGVGAVYQRHEFMAEREAALQLWADHVLKVARPDG